MKNLPAGSGLANGGVRHQLASKFRALRNQVVSGHAAEACEGLTHVEDWYQPIALEDLSSLLLQTLAWEQPEQNLAFELHNTASTLADLARLTALAAAKALPRGDERVPKAIALAVLAWSRASLLEHVSSVPPAKRQRFHDLHRLFDAAERHASTELPMPLTCNGKAMEVSVEGLYVRALLLNRLSGGNLNAQQILILDNWLLAWMPSMWVTATPPEGEIALSVTMGGDAGLQHGAFAVADDVRYVCVAPLRQRLDQSVASLHQGELFPGWGLASALRIEDHVGVIDSLERELAQIESAVPLVRLPRTQAFGMVVEAHIGVTSAIGSSFEASGKPLRLRLQDHTESGVGLHVEAGEGGHVRVGDLISMSLFPEQAPVIGEVVRKRPAAAEGEFAIGVRFIARETLPLALVHEGKPGHHPEVQALYIAGTDRSGRHDAILVSDSVFRAARPLRSSDGDEGEVFRVHLNRVRHRGRGWVLAGFEMILDGDDDGKPGQLHPAPMPVSKLPLELADWPEGHVR